MKQQRTALVDKSTRRSITAIEAAREVPAQYQRPRSRKIKRQALRQAGEFADWLKAKRANQPLVRTRLAFDPMAMMRAQIRSLGMIKRKAVKPATTAIANARQTGTLSRTRESDGDLRP